MKKTLKTPTHLFNFRLFLEGLKRLRVIGLVTAILALVASALIPIVTWIETSNHNAATLPNEIVDNFLCIPAGFVVFLAPFFFYTLFSFLQKRNESDFFHTIPYTRTCVYVSFVTAALAFISAIQVACGLLSWVLWSLCPYVIFDAGALWSFIPVTILAAALLSSFMMLALTVSGTPGSCTLLFVLFASFVRIVAGICIGLVESITLLPHSHIWTQSILAPSWFLPVGILYWLVAALETVIRPANLIYSLVVTVLIYVLAGYLYGRRRSEMAGNPAPGLRTQTLFRVMFSLPLAFLITMALVAEKIDDLSVYVVLIVATVIGYFLYELITTKRARNMLRAARQFWLVPAACVVFAISLMGCRYIILHDTLTVDDIEAISVADCGFNEGSYQALKCSDVRITDKEVLRIVADQLTYSQKVEGKGRAGDKYYWNRQNITIYTKGGRTLERRIIIPPEQERSLIQMYAAIPEIQKYMYMLPSDQEIRDLDISIQIALHENFSISWNRWGQQEEIQQLMKIFREEFLTLTDVQKTQVLQLGMYNTGEDEVKTDGGEEWNGKNSRIELRLMGHVVNPKNDRAQNFYNTYTITDAMPKTRAYMLLTLAGNSDNVWRANQNTYHGTADDILSMGEEYMLRNEEEMGQRMFTVNDLSILSSEKDDQLIIIKSENVRPLLTFLREHLSVQNKTAPSTYTVTENTVALVLVLQAEDVIYMDMFGLFELTDEDIGTIRQWLEPASESI